MLKKAFAMFDQGKTGFIETNRVAAILNTMGQQFDANELAVTIEETDKDSKTKLLTNVRNIWLIIVFVTIRNN